MAFLVFLSGDLKGRKFELDQDVLHIGRSSENKIHLDDASVSSRHCTLETGDQGVILTDLNSTNGTFVNGERISGSVMVVPGDNIQLGEIKILFDDNTTSARQGNGTHTSTTGITVVTGTGMRPIPRDQAGPFVVKKDRRVLWISVIVLGITAALSAFAWFIYQLFFR